MLQAGVIAPGIFDGEFVQFNYVLTVRAMWHSAALFETNGWTVRTIHEEALALGAKAMARVNICSAGAKRQPPSSHFPLLVGRVVRRCRWCVATARAEAARLLVEREKFSCAVSR